MLRRIGRASARIWIIPALLGLIILAFLFASGSNLTGGLPGSLRVTAVSETWPLPVYPPPGEFPTGGHFEFPFWLVGGDPVYPGTHRQFTVSTAWSYDCHTPLAPWDYIGFQHEDCAIIAEDFAHRGSLTAGPWARNHTGIATSHIISAGGQNRRIYIHHGENKNEYIGGECMEGGVCHATTVPARGLPACSSCADHNCEGEYRPCWSAYFAFITLSWAPWDWASAYGRRSITDEGPIVWPTQGYLWSHDQTKASDGVRHPHSIVDEGYIWLYYVDAGTVRDSAGPTVRLARAPVQSGGAAGTWKVPCPIPGPPYGRLSWQNALPAGFDRRRINEFYDKQGSCGGGLRILSSLSDAHVNSFAVAKTVQGRYLGIEERNGHDGVWSLRLHVSTDLINWQPVDSTAVMPIPPAPPPPYWVFPLGQIVRKTGGYAGGDLHYPVFLNTDGWRNDLIDERGFFIIGSDEDSTVHAMWVEMSGA